MLFRKAFRWYLKRAIVLASDWTVVPIRNQEVTPCFIAGCGHSGTTLVASKLGQHPAIFTIRRESQIFYPNKSLLHPKGIVKEWIYISKQDQKICFVEKTPKHIHCLNRIRRLLPESKLILITRNPMDTIASLYLRFNDLSLSIERWNLDNEALLNWKEKPNTHLIYFEELIAEPERVFRDALTFLGLDWHSEVLEGGQSVYETHIAVENMKIRAQQVKKKIYKPESKWPELFSKEQQNRMIQETAAISERLGYLVF